MAIFAGGFTTPGTSAVINLVLQVDVAGQSIANNTTTLNWQLRMEKGAAGTPFRNYHDAAANAYVNGLVLSVGGMDYNFPAGPQTIVVSSGSTVVGHNADGTKTIGVSAAYDGKNPIGTASLSNVLVLPTIPRNRTMVGYLSAWHTAEVYVGVNGVWQMAMPYVGDAGTWKMVQG